MTAMKSFPREIVDLISKLSVEQKVSLVSGDGPWSTTAIPEIGLRRMVMSDGPSGVRGEVWDERHKSFTLPSATCTSATWNRDALTTLGAISALEARSKGVSIVLGPTINLHRSPLGGRHFEAFSEDPYLTGELSVSYIKGAQDNGVATTPKHYVANDSENERFTVDAIVDERTLREVYLAPFEDSVVDGEAWGMMAAYNAVNGETMTENDLLRTPLQTEWGFDGFMVSDWTAVRSVEEAGNAGLDLAMPGPATIWNEGLLAAVQAGTVSMDALDDKVARLLLLAQRVGALGDSVAKTPARIDARAEIRTIAAQGMVLVENSGVLPLAGASSIAVIGQHAEIGRIGGGGSATTIPYDSVSPLRGIREAAPAGATVAHAYGVYSVDALEDYPLEQITASNGEHGIDVSWFGEEGNLLESEVRYANFLTRQWPDISLAAKSVKASTTFTAVVDGVHRFGGGGMGHLTVYINGEQRISEKIQPEGADPAEALLAPPQRYVDIELAAGEQVVISTEFVTDIPLFFGLVTSIFGYRAPRKSEQAEWDEAIALAKASDVAIVVVGTTALVESEGHDRDSLALPGQQDALVDAVIAANPNTIVVVNAGSPVEMPWRTKAAAVVLTWFPGEEYGHALADVLFGHAEPGGRLPTTWPVAMADVPVLDTTPKDGKLVYSEGLNIGYRAWAASGKTPAYEFGYGLGYTTWELVDFTAPANVAPGEDFEVTVSMTNTGDRDGSDVVQIYASRENSTVTRPPLWLCGFDRVSAEAGETVSVTLTIKGRAFADWASGWNYEVGTFTLSAARSVKLDGALNADVTVN
ncbi:beta-glucosidase [Aurantimicrobium minutum]|nr:beta-glucosidase [Aurantimicrobium minutum]